LAFHGKSPELLGLNEVYQYQVYLAQQKKASWCITNQRVCAVRFFYTKTLHRQWDIRHIPCQKQGQKLPTVLSKEEVGISAEEQHIIDQILSALHHAA